MTFLEITVLNGKQQTQQEIQYREVRGTSPNIPIHDVFKLKNLYKYIKCVCKFQYLQGVKFPKFSAGTDRSLHMCIYVWQAVCTHHSQSASISDISTQIFCHVWHGNPSSRASGCPTLCISIRLLASHLHAQAGQMEHGKGEGQGGRNGGRLGKDLARHLWHSACEVSATGCQTVMLMYRERQTYEERDRERERYREEA